MGETFFRGTALVLGRASAVDSGGGGATTGFVEKNRVTFLPKIVEMEIGVMSDCTKCVYELK